MSAGGSKLRDVSVLADEGALVSVEIPVRELQRLLPELAAETGTARGELRFLRSHGVPAADLQLSADLTLRCQRCLQPLHEVVSTDSRVHFPPDEDAAARLPVEDEAMLAPEGRVKLADVVAEDLLLALPLSPRHADEAACAQAEASVPLTAATTPVEEEDVRTRRPFAALAEMMGRESRHNDDPAGKPKGPRTRR